MTSRAVIQLNIVSLVRVPRSTFGIFRERWKIDVLRIRGVRVLRELLHGIWCSADGNFCNGNVAISNVAPSAAKVREEQARCAIRKGLALSEAVGVTRGLAVRREQFAAQEWVALPLQDAKVY